MAEDQKLGEEGTAQSGGGTGTETNEKAMSILAYILFFVPLLVGAHKTSEAVKYHTNQGTVLFIAAVISSVAFGIISAILTGILTGVLIATGGYGGVLVITTIFSIIWLVYVLGVTALIVIGIINAVNNRCKPLPLIGKITIIK
jgi:uncharacterized membrane protein